MSGSEKSSGSVLSSESSEGSSASSGQSYFFSGGSGSSSGSSSSTPFSLLTIRYIWTEMPDLDSGTEFLGSVVGYGLGVTADYMTWTGDAQTVGGTETVTVDLAAAWAAGVMTDLGGTYNVSCSADWFPFADDDPSVEPNPNPGTGPATLEIEYNGIIESYQINPGSVTPSTTPVAEITIHSDGTFSIDLSP